MDALTSTLFLPYTKANRIRCNGIRPNRDLCAVDRGHTRRISFSVTGFGRRRFQSRYDGLRGHGESTAGFTDYSLPAVGRDILALAHHLGSGPVSIIGTSKAGAAAVWAAAQEPDAIDHLVLVSALVRAHSRHSAQKAVMTASFPAVGTDSMGLVFPQILPEQKASRL